MRTFKDAKSMAKSLRDSLAARGVSFSHSECLEMVAKQFGVADWNTLAAKVDTASHCLARPENSQSVLQSEQIVSCSFCGKSQHEVPHFVEGGCSRAPRAADGRRAQESCVFMCVECVTFCAQVIADTRAPRG